MVPILAGMAAAAASVVFWQKWALASGYHGYFAMLIGALIGYVVAIVGRAQRGPRLQLMSLALAILTLLVGNYVVVNALAHQLAAKNAIETSRFIAAGKFVQGWQQLTYPIDSLYLLVGLLLAGLVPHRRKNGIKVPGEGGLE